MNGWKFALNPPFADGLFSEQQTAAWETLKKQLPLGTILTGKVYIQTQFGVFYNAELGFPVLLRVVEFNVKQGPILFPDDYPALDSVLTGRLVGFDNGNRQLDVMAYSLTTP
ncbi:hypothetical protein QMK33_14585 [Hymenobacter sp. H14-R3]|uniref:hypothetical protein n=1 Tax=Hymenobacter sp. H14-R3 TaxID=3046308 RepID=UPI0024BABE6A|nr:hypothetical protein [Hymenobacter sp. H14-R3]MDJ0366382.1 hypothetical protein [Hymenobacter sp. H14-R3]